MAETAVVILNFNGRKYLEQFLPSVIQHTKKARIIVADNGSTDDSCSFIEANYKQVELFKLEANYGFTGGYNRILKKIEADIFVLLNSDVEVTANWLDPIVSLLEDHEDIAACQPRIISYKDKDKFDYAGAGGGYIDYLGFPFCRGRLFNTIENDTGQYDDTLPVFWASGACLFVKKKAFFEMGGFDEDFFAHMEEIDLCWRLQNGGYKVYYNGQSKVYHVGGGTLSRSNPLKTYLNFRNGLSMFLKNEKPRRLWWKLPARSALDMVAIIKFIFSDSWPDGIAVLKAHLHFWLGLRSNLNKRKNTKKLWTQSKTAPQIYRGFVVFDYFLMGKKTFSKLNFRNK